MLLELLIEKVPLRFAEALQHHLLGSLRRDTAGVMGQWFGGRDLVTQLGALLDGLGVGNGNFFVAVLNRFHYGFQSKNTHFPSIGVEGDRYILP